jgi:Tfp pilus assembly protein FimV
MDRGVKIAIFVASIVSLALGLIWDQVLNQARTVAQDRTINVDELGPDLISAVVGPPEVPRLKPPEGFEVRQPAEYAADGSHQPATSTDPANQTPAPANNGWEEYTLQKNDSAWALAHDTFRDRGLKVEDLEAANPGCKWRVGDKVRIPPKSGAVAPQSNTTERQPTVAGYANGNNANGPIEYVVQENDSWWKIAHVHFKDRGKSSEEIEAANPGKKLRPGVKITIP